MPEKAFNFTLNAFFDSKYHTILLEEVLALSECMVIMKKTQSLLDVA